MKGILQAAAIIIGLILIVIPDPATTMAGIVLVLAAFGLED